MFKAKKFSEKISPDLRFRAKKSLGQHFLTDQSVLKTIIEAANLTAKDTAIEIGPGEGFLTAALIETGARVIAVEKDDRLISPLAKKFKPEILAHQLELIHADILDLLQTKKLTRLARQIGGLQANSYKLVANIPYYLTGQIIRRFLTALNQPQTMTLMLQKEVAERIIAKDGKESLLSISVKAYGIPRYIRTVPPGAFRPAPRVDSAILQIDQINKNNFQAISEEKFFVLVKRGFVSKRKMLRSKLELTIEKFAACGIVPNARAENLTIDQWFCLARQKQFLRKKNRPRAFKHETDCAFSKTSIPNLGNATRSSEDPK